MSYWLSVPWVRRLVACPSPRGPVHVGFMVDKAALGQVVVRRFSPVYIMIQTLRTDKEGKYLKRQNKAFAEIGERRLEQ